MSLKSKMPFQVWLLTLSAFAIGMAEFVIAGVLPQVADSLQVTEGQAGGLITAYALAIVIGGPILTLWLARFEKRAVLIGLMALFIAGNLIAAFTSSYGVLLVSRVIAGLTQGPFFGIGAVVAMKLVPDKLAGQAIGQMFAGLTLANVLGVPAGTWIGNTFGWNMTFLFISGLGVLTAMAIAAFVPVQGRDDAASSIRRQLGAFRDRIDDKIADTSGDGCWRVHSNLNDRFARPFARDQFLTDCVAKVAKCRAANFQQVGENKRQSLIDVPSSAPSKFLVSSSLVDVVPQMIIRSPRLTARNNCVQRRKNTSKRGLTKIRSGHCRCAVIEGIANRTPNFLAS